MTYEKMIAQLQTKFPNLITDESMIDCDVGWYRIISSYCEMIDKLVEKGICEYQPIYQIKEKFGSMRIHHAIQVNTDDQDDIGFDICRAIQSYTENKSVYTCESCGEFGEIKKINGWLKCLCEDCKGGNG